MSTTDGPGADTEEVVVEEEPSPVRVSKPKGLGKRAEPRRSGKGSKEPKAKGKSVIKKDKHAKSASGKDRRKPWEVNPIEDWQCPNVTCQNHERYVWGKKDRCGQCGAKKPAPASGSDGQTTSGPTTSESKVPEPKVLPTRGGRVPEPKVPPRVSRFSDEPTNRAYMAVSSQVGSPSGFGTFAPKVLDEVSDESLTGGNHDGAFSSGHFGVCGTEGEAVRFSRTCLEDIFHPGWMMR